MSDVLRPTDCGPAPVEQECARVELLGQCTGQLRRGEPLDEAVLSRLRDLEAGVRRARHGGAPWGLLGAENLGELEHDLLACAVAPELEPRVGWLFQQLQPGTTKPYPTLALVQEMLAMSPSEGRRLASVVADGAPLRALLEIDDVGLYAPIRPAHGVTARLLGASGTAHVASPPGTLLVPPGARWEDLVVRADREALLREFLHWVQLRTVVVGEWGGKSVGGPVALFAGPAGTGKTLAASVLAAELGFALYRVDIGSLVSKYIGETEKNLNRLFSSAHGRPIMLQFDEADALFGKRGEIKEARDRYANLEVSHLLSRIEQHDGPCVLTTNLRGNLDPAFARRFQVVIDFPRPDAAARARLWRLHIPPRAPRAELDFDFLGRAVNLTGGGIRNAALHASYLAAARAGSIGMPDIALAVFRELGKDGRPLVAADLGSLANHLCEALVS